jgi:hypothetical protein
VGGGEGIRKGWRRANMVEELFMYENGTVRLIETVLRRDGGERWRD